MARITVRFGFDTIVITGVVAGILFIAFEMLAAAALMGTEAAVVPVRMIGAIVIGAEALDPSYSSTAAAMTGLALHLVLSVLFTALFAAIVTALGNVARGEAVTSAHTVVLAGVVFAVGLWVVNFYVIAPAAGWIWFTERTDPAVQLLAHAVLFGWPVGWMLGRSGAERKLTI
jgi:hypothetical protein